MRKSCLESYEDGKVLKNFNLKVKILFFPFNLIFSLRFFEGAIFTTKTLKNYVDVVPNT